MPQLEEHQPAELGLRIHRGESWHPPLWFFERHEIISSTRANPSVLETRDPHNLVDGHNVRIVGHKENTVVNGLHVATVVDDTHFSVPVSGIARGGNSGLCGTPEDISDKLFAMDMVDENSQVVVSATLTPTDAVNGELTVSLTPTQTAAITQDALKYDLWEVTDSNNKFPRAEGDVEIIAARTVR